jgi:hypothetical protein
MKQFLLNPDGSIPPGTNVAVLLENGIRLVRPNPQPRPSPGMMMVDTEPVLVNGIWHQCWKEVPAPVVEEEDVQL